MKNSEAISLLDEHFDLCALVVNLSMEVTLHARLQNRTCRFHGIRLLNYLVVVIHTSFVNIVMTVAMQQSEISFHVVYMISIFMMNFQYVIMLINQFAVPAFSSLPLE